MTEFGFPFEIDPRGRTASADPPAHLRQLFEQLLLTAPGERVNRPTFGTGLAQLVHEPSSNVLAEATQVLIQGELQRCLGERAEVQAVEVRSEESELEVTVRYRPRAGGESRVEVFRRPAA
jgi:phage baseplate assembly protein W